MTHHTTMIRDRIKAVLRTHGLLTTAQIADDLGWVWDSVEHKPGHPHAAVGFYHTFGPDHPRVRLLGCDGEQCLLTRRVTTEEVRRHCASLAKLGILGQIKSPGVQAIGWYLATRPAHDEVGAELEATWLLPAQRGERRG